VSKNVSGALVQGLFNCLSFRASVFSTCYSNAFLCRCFAYGQFSRRPAFEVPDAPPGFDNLQGQGGCLLVLPESELDSFGDVTGRVVAVSLKKWDRRNDFPGLIDDKYELRGVVVKSADGYRSILVHDSLYYIIGESVNKTAAAAGSFCG
jgi:hypothetical protein